MQQPQNVYLVWDYWFNNNTYYAIYEKELDGKLYFSEAKAEEKEKPKLLENKKKLNWFIKLLKRKNNG
jgi:hypothetical protein